MCAMPDNQTRLDALRKGITTAKDEGYVTIRVADLRWLLDLASETTAFAGGETHSRDDATDAPVAFDLERDLIDDPEHE